MKNCLRVKGSAIIRRIKNGKVIQETIVNNLVVDSGLEQLAKLLCGVSSEDFGYIAVGTSSVATNISQTELEAEVKREEAVNGGEYIGSNEVTFEKTFEFLEALTITEAGVFNSLASTNSVMFDRFVFTGQEVGVGTDLYIKVNIRIKPE